MVRRVGRNIRRLASSHDCLGAAERHFDLAIEDGKHLLKVVAMGWRATSGRNEHVDETIASGSVLARQQDRVGVSS
jgi:hypothetical protein